MSTIRLEIHITPELAAALDLARGLVPRAAWVRALLERGTSDANKKLLLKMARTKAKTTPEPGDNALFEKEIRRLAPHWFKKPKAKAKKPRKVTRRG